MNGYPSSGEEFITSKDEDAVKLVASSREYIIKAQHAASQTASKHDMLRASILQSTLREEKKEVIKVPIVIKADNFGSLEAIRLTLQQMNISDDDGICIVDIVHCGIGELTSNDVNLAHESKGVLVAFNTKVPSSVQKICGEWNTKVVSHNVIYHLLNDVEILLKNKLFPPPPGNLLGTGRIKQIFNLNRIGKIAGMEVLSGTIKMDDSRVRIMRGHRNCLYTGKIKSLNSGKLQIRDIGEGSECGISFIDFSDFLEEDVVECFTA